MPSFGIQGSGRSPGLVAVLLLLLLVACSPRPDPGPRAVQGLLDLRAQSLGSPGLPGPSIVELKGEWEFYPGRFLSSSDLTASSLMPTYRRVPDQWKGRDVGGSQGQGWGTYRLVVLLPPETPSLALRYKTLSTAFELEVDGRVLARVGRPGTTASESRAAYRPGVVPLPAQGQRMEILVRASNFEYRIGGMWRAFALGASEPVFASKRLADIAAYALVAAIFVMALNSFMLYIFRRQDKAHLWFALFGLSLAFRQLVTGEYLLVEYLPAISFDLLIRLEYVSVALPIPLLALFLAELFPRPGSKTLLWIIVLPFMARLFLGTTLVALPLLTRSVMIFYPMAVAAVLVMLLGLVLPAVASRKEGALPILGGGAILLAAFVNDSLYTSFVINTGNFLGIGMIGFIVVQSGVLGRRFSRAFDQGEALQEELAQVNGRLEEENRLYRESQVRLEKALAEKDLLYREVHHRVKNSLQIVSSTLGLQAHRTDDPKALEVYSMARSRIRAISLVHEKLYGMKSAEAMDLGEYARDLVSQLGDSYGAAARKVELEVRAGTLAIGADDCVDLGLILTELVANACKHASQEGRQVKVVVALGVEPGRIWLRVEDDGPGFPPGFDPSKTQSLGFRVIWSLAMKHDGEVRILPGPGARIEITLAIGETAGEGMTRGNHEQ